jgi:hypothetical protein
VNPSLFLNPPPGTSFSFHPTIRVNEFIPEIWRFNEQTHPRNPVHGL